MTCEGIGDTVVQPNHGQGSLQVLDQRKQLTCEHCKREFKTKKTLNQHLSSCRVRIGNGRLPFECLKCKRTFSRKFVLDRHHKKCLQNRPLKRPAEDQGKEINWIKKINK